MFQAGLTHQKNVTDVTNEHVSPESIDDNSTMKNTLKVMVLKYGMKQSSSCKSDKSEQQHFPYMDREVVELQQLLPEAFFTSTYPYYFKCSSHCKTIIFPLTEHISCSLLYSCKVNKFVS